MDTDSGRAGAMNNKARMDGVEFAVRSALTQKKGSRLSMSDLRKLVLADSQDLREYGGVVQMDEIVRCVEDLERNELCQFNKRAQTVFVKTGTTL